MMMTIRVFLVLYLALLFKDVSSQEKTTEVIQTFYPNHSVYEEYTISLPDSLQNGGYKRFTQGGRIWVAGDFKNNLKSGIWIWYVNTEARVRDTVEVYNYDKREQIFFNYDRSLGGSEYIGGFQEFRFDFEKSLKIKEVWIEKYQDKKITVCFKVNCSGEIYDLKFDLMSQFRDAEIEAAIKRALMETAPFWKKCGDNDVDKQLPISLCQPVYIR
jgi:hypothetical protein